MDPNQLSPVPEAIRMNTAVGPAVRAMTPSELAVALTEEVRLSGVTWRVAEDFKLGRTMLYGGYLQWTDKKTCELHVTWKFRVSLDGARQVVQHHRDQHGAHA